MVADLTIDLRASIYGHVHTLYREDAEKLADAIWGEIEQIVQREAKLRETLNGCLGCMCHFQHAVNPNRELIQKEIDNVLEVLAQSEYQDNK